MILVVGQLRSGTTAVARLLHHLGCPMGSTMCFPVASAHACLDYEDYTPIHWINAGRPIEEWWGEYVKARTQVHADYVARGLSYSREWGVKSPFFLPYLPYIRENTPDLKVILCTRGKIERGASMRRQARAAKSPRVRDLAVEKAQSFEQYEPDHDSVDMVIPFESLKGESGRRVAKDLAAMIGSQEDPVAVMLDVQRHWEGR